MKEVRKFFAENIDWDIDFDEFLDTLRNMSYDKAAEFVGCPKDKYANMNDGERYDWAYATYRRCPGAVIDVMGLPDKVEIPECFGIKNATDDMSEVTEWLSDEYGFCISGYEVKEVKNIA